MSWTSGFFNSVNGDRRYNADQMSAIFDGLITNGVYKSVGNKLAVQSNNGMTIQINTGRGWFNGRWVNNASPYLQTLEASDVLLNRYCAVCVRIDLTESNRKAEPYFKYSEFATNPIKPTMERSDTVCEYCLAYVYIKAGTSVITDANIEDTRSNKELCGWVTGLIEQLDTTTMYKQWEALFFDWFNNLETYLDESVETKLTNDVNQLLGDVSQLSNNVSQLSNPNLLINGDFQVWQRGESFENVSPNVYTADRWKNTKLNTQNLSVEKDDNGMKLTTTDSRTVITQYIERRLLNENYTLSLSVDGVKLSTTFRATDTSWLTKDLYHNGEKVVVAAFQVQNGNCTSIEIYIQKQSAVLNWVKLEQGSVATPFIPRSYGEELELCQRYHQRLNLVPVYTTHSAGNYYYGVKFIVNMRGIPTVTLIDAKDNSSNIVSDVSIVSTNSTTYQMSNVQLNKSLGQYGYLSIIADAEIY